jgi:purine-binding chemotaxis protein CheW
LLGSSHRSQKIVVFQLFTSKYGFSLEQVFEIVQMVAITNVPDSTDWIAGVISVRGQVVPIINLRTRFNLPPQKTELNTPIILTNYKNRLVGLIVDEIVGVFSFSSLSMTPPEDIEIEAAYIESFAVAGQELVSVLNLENVIEGIEALLSDKKIKV